MTRENAARAKQETPRTYSFPCRRAGLTFCAAASEALDWLAAGQTQQAASVLQKALLDAEELYVAEDLP